MRVIVFDTETTGLPKFRKAHPSKSELYPYICQFSWLVYDDKTNEFYTRDYIIKLPNGVTIPEECTKIHGITNEKMLSEGVDIKEVLREFTRDWLKCQILIAHNLNFDNRVIQAEYFRNEPINWLGRHRKIEYCTMNYGKKFTNIQLPSKFNSGTYQKPPKLIELHKELFSSEPSNLHNSLVDVLACFRCYFKMVYGKDILDENINKTFYNYYKEKCGL
jgi:DNA polymerase III epsilon subunit-like protein